MRKYMLLFALISLMESSCFHEDCHNPRFALVLINFTNSEMDSIIFKTYKSGSNFTLLKDSVRIKNRTCFFYQIGRDTQYIYCDSLFTCSELIDMEWQVVGTSANKRISKIHISQEHQKHGLLAFDRFPCYNPISYLEDSVTVNLNKYESGPEIEIYLKK